MLADFFTRIRLFFHREKESFFVLRKILGFFPKNIALYEEALSHKSVHGLQEFRDRQSNERLEFLGDAVLNAIVADIVFQKYPGRNEGFLTQTRSFIVNRELLDRLAVEIGLDRLVVATSVLKMSARKNHISGNALEAIIGAIYVDLGYYKARRFIEKKIIKTCIDIDSLACKELNFKSQLLEWIQRNHITLEYQITDLSTDDHRNTVFHCDVFLNGELSGSGKGLSKRAAQQEAARMALLEIRK